MLLVVAVLPSCLLMQEGRVHRYIRYTVRDGDSLYAIAQRFSVSTKEIRTVNAMPSDERPTVGMFLKIPYRGQSLGKTGGMAVKPNPDKASLRMISLNEAKRYIGKLLWPVNGAHLSSRFGKRWSSFHEGMDLAGPMGVPIRAAHDGVVVYSDDGLRGYGNLVVVKGEGLLTVYGHNRSNVVERGDRVRKGEVLAYLGNTGKSTGPHLHYETRIRDNKGKFVAVDPLAFYPRLTS